MCFGSLYSPFGSVSPCKGPNADLEEMPKKTDLRPPSPSNLLSIPNSPLTISPISHRSVVAVSLYGGEACMCILTRAVLRYPPPTHAAAAAATRPLC